jgi:hypothetical protein
VDYWLLLFLLLLRSLQLLQVCWAAAQPVLLLLVPRLAEV